MMLGQYIFTGDEASGPWNVRQADNAVFTYEVIFTAGGAANTDLTVKVFHKNREDAGYGTEITGITWTSLSGSVSYVAEANVTGLKELVRFQFDHTGTSGRLRCRMLGTSWYDTPNA